MAEDKVVAEVPVVETPKLETPEPVIINRREALESKIEAENETIPEAVVEDTQEVKAPVVETDAKEEVELDPVQRIKKSMQKRVDKLTAKTKSAEEELAELRLENERLKANPKEPEQEIVKDDAPPTIEQVEDYIAKMQEEGNHKEATKAIRYMVQLEKAQAIKEMRDEQNKVQTQTKEVEARTNHQMKELASDYVVLDDKGEPDISADMTLANQKGLLFKLSMDYFNDKARHGERYNDPNVVNGFRRAVADAYRDIAEHNRLNRLTPKGEETVVRRPRSAALADPDAAYSDDAPSQSNNTSTLSDADVVRAEIKARKTRR